MESLCEQFSDHYNMFSGIIKKSQILPSEALSFGQMLPEGC